MTTLTQTKILTLISILCLSLFSFTAVAQGYGVHKIVIDAGHGGRDPGAVGKKCKEKDVVLNVALLLGSYIEQKLDDVEVIYTRKNDTYIDLNRRAEIANEAQADLFISIHANAVGNSSVYGAETFVMGMHKNESNLEIAQRENAVITFEDNFEEKYEGFDPKSSESYIIFNFTQNAFKEQSAALATLIQDQYTNRVGRKDRQVQEAGFLVLAKTTMPSVLTELGFLTNAKEEGFLVTKKGQDYMASALFRAVRDYKIDMDSKQSIHLSATEKEAQVEITTPEPNSAVHNITYKLQILSSSEVLSPNDRTLRNLDDVDYYQAGKLYKYTIGNSEDISTIVPLQKKYKSRFKGCFVVAFDNGTRISIDKARQFQAVD